jgi:uncharacterized protein (DUF4213/DUF364 family)
MAAINSLIEVDESRCEELNAGKLLAEKGAGKRVAVIGHFPFLSDLRKAARELWTIELQPREGDLPATEAANLLPRADVIGITGTAIINSTLEPLLALCRPEAYVVLLGGTAPLSPVLFAYGIDAVSGTKVINSEAVIKHVSQGATYRQIKGVRRLTMQKTTG